MLLQQVTLALLALGFVVFGVWFGVKPDALTDLTTVALPGPTARTEVRAFYGGLELGIAAFLLLCALRPDLMRGGLVFSALALGATALARFGGGLVEGELARPLVIAGALEVGGAVAAVAALLRMPASPPT